VKPVIANASPLIALAKIDRFSLLKQLFEEIWIPDAVWEEVVVQGMGKPAADLTLAAKQELWLQRHSTVDKLAVEVLQATLGAGEAEAIVLAQEVSAKWILLDDDLARAQAERLGLRVKGSVGILLAGYRAHHIDDLRADMNMLRTQGFWLSDQLYRIVLEKAGYTLS
jgi:hypothetical protein